MSIITTADARRMLDDANALALRMAAHEKTLDELESRARAPAPKPAPAPPPYDAHARESELRARGVI